jgi:hypothetical protein
MAALLIGGPHSKFQGISGYGRRFHTFPGFASPRTQHRT